MEHVTYTDLRQNLARYLNEAADSRAPMLVTRQGGKRSVVILSADELAGWWPRRIHGEHRLVYRIAGRPGTDQHLKIAACRYYY